MTEKKRTNCSGSEWVGGRLVAPMYITEDAPYRPEVILWMELPEGVVVGTHLMNPCKRDLSFGESLIRAMRAPMVGAPRRPRRVRVADATLATEVRAVLGDDVDVTVSPTPELHELVRMMSEHIGQRDDGEPASYFDGGRVSPATVEALFRAASILFGIAPWKFMDDSQVVRVDIPKLGIDGGCLSVIGALGEHLGIVLFPSLAGWEAFCDLEPPQHQGDPIDLGTGYLSLSFERGADLPDPMRREVAAHAWPVDGPNAYPRVERRDSDGMPRPLVDRDVRIISACATSFAAFSIKHRGLFERGSGPPISESYCGDDDIVVRFTVPYDAHSLFEIDEPPARDPAAPTPRVGRNAPCPCGSGKKYKKCCLGVDEPVRRKDAKTENIHERDARLVADIYQWAIPRFGEAWMEALGYVADDNVAAQLLVSWCAYHAVVGGRRVVDRFLDSRRHHLSDDDRSWLTSQRDAWLSMWEIVACEPGVGLQLRDLLSGELRQVRELSGSKTLVKRDAVLARVVDHGGVSVFSGMFLRPLPPSEAAEVVRRVRGRLRLKRAVPVERLRDEAIGRYMVRAWDEAVDRLVERARIPPKFTNTDGDDLRLITDYFEFDAMLRPQVEERLMEVDGAHVVEHDEAVARIDFRRQDDDYTIVGHAELSTVALTLETNSLRRADRLRQLIERSCGAGLRHCTRESTDPHAPRQGLTTPTPEPPGAAEIVRSFKERHYRNWVDEALPALNGQTPRQAIRSKAGRQRVDVLLKDMENMESRLPEDHRHDFTQIRCELGLEP